MRLPLLSYPLLAASLLSLTACPTRPGDDDDDATNGDDDDSVDLCDGIDGVAGTDVSFELLASGLNLPLGLVAHPTDADLLLVLLQGGQVIKLRDGTNEGSFIDISGQVRSGGEAGLLGMAFAPDFASSGLFYLHYDTPGGGGAGFESTISEFSVGSDPLSGDASTERILLQVPQPASNHNGGSIEFGHDGMLYIGLGDGGGGGDSYCTGSDGSSYLAKILRIDPTASGSSPYTIPADNPFVGDSNVIDEAWAWGLRNPWRFTFDRQTGQMWIGDVGQNAYEEIDIGQAGAHYGWSAREGNHPFSSSCSNISSGWTDAYFEYAQGFSGGSVTGGYVYRGCQMPDLHGQYFFADAVTGQAWRIPSSGATSSTEVWNGQGFYELVSWGEDQTGELYVVKLFSGQVWKMVPAG